jgi:GT2 family glycosyltransferase
VIDFKTTPTLKVTAGFRPYVAVVIPSLRKATEELVARLRAQTWAPDDIQVVIGVKPNGRARNLGVQAALARGMPLSDSVLVFIDDDALPGSSRVIETLITILLGGNQLSEPIGVVGAARVLPSGSSWFQRRVAAEIPRTVNGIPTSPLESNPPLEGYGHSLITTTCCALKLSVFQEAGGFSETLSSGVDTDFFFRVRQRGYHFILAPGEHVEHPAPRNPCELWRKFYWYGIGYSQETRRRPAQKMGPRLHTPLRRAVFILASTLWLVPNVFILYSYGYPHFELGFRPLKALSTYAVAWGYHNGWRLGFVSEIEGKR